MSKNPASRLLHYVQKTSEPWWKYIPIVFLIAFIPSALISLALNLVFRPEAPMDLGELSIPLVLSLVLLAPLLETLIMWPIVSIIQRFIPGQAVVTAIVSAAVWGIFHGIQAPVWGLTVAWSFFIFSLCFVTWKKLSVFWAIGYVTSIHAMQNLLAVGYILMRSG